jgi:membrane-bound serine protease (ClpP class)
MNVSIYVNPWVLSIIIIAAVVLLVFVVIWVVRAHQRHVTAGKEGLIGETAVVETTLAPKGMVLVEGEHWQATLDTGRAEPEEEVTVTKVEGLRLRVTKKVKGGN